MDAPAQLPPADRHAIHALINAGEADSALAVLRTAFAQLDTTGHHVRYELLELRSMAHQRAFRLAEAMESAMMAQQAAEASGDTDLVMRALMLVAHIQYLRDDHDASLALHRRQMGLFSAATDSSHRFGTYHEVASILYLRNEFDSAAHYYRLALRMAQGGRPVDRVTGAINLAGVFAETGRTDTALAILAALVPPSPDLPPRIQRAVFATHGYVLYEDGDMRGAVAAYDSAQHLNERFGQEWDVSMEYHGFMADAHAALGEYRAAYGRMQLLEAARDSFDRHARNEQVEDLKQRYQADLRERDIAVLQARDTERAERLRRREVQAFGTALLAVLAVLVVALLLRDRRRRHGYTRELERLNTELRDRKERIEEVNRLLQLKVLRTQMNPHFIYNCLNAIANLVRKGEGVAAGRYLDGFARLLRMVLDHSLKDRVPIAQELDFLRQYLELEALRFPDGLHWSVEVDRELLDEDVDVPALLVQPFVENAVWHGLAAKEGEKRVRARFDERGDDGMCCVVEDNGVGRHAAPPRTHVDGSPGVGLQLTGERLQLLTYKLDGDKGRIRFEDLYHPDGGAAGTRVELRLG
ncbi:MAG: histidine kinase [Flavobacteriales bacterium]|jgi:tetratricopeptide (TPR) repeat protein|nr:histidine kinase [Flavobacteriales bacterium]